MIKHLVLLKELPGVPLWTTVYQDCATWEINTESTNPFLIELIKSYKEWKYLKWFSDKQEIQYELSDVKKLLSTTQINELTLVISDRLNKFNTDNFWLKHFYSFVKKDINKYTELKWFGIKILEFILLSFVQKWVLLNKGKLGKWKFRKSRK